MSDAWPYTVWPDPRSRSWAIESWKSFHLQTLFHPPFTMGSGNWPLTPKLGHNIHIWSGRIFDIFFSYSVTWLWTWPKRQLRRVDRQSRTGLIYLIYLLTLWCVLFSALCADSPSGGVHDGTDDNVGSPTSPVNSCISSYDVSSNKAQAYKYHRALWTNTRFT